MAENQKNKKFKLSKLLYWLLLAALIGIFLYSAGSLLKYYLDSQASQATYQDLQDLRGDHTRPSYVPTQPEATSATDSTQPAPTEPPLVEVTDPQTGETVKVLPEFAELYVKNPDLIGWMTLPGTNIDYPVVYKPESPDFYLHRDFYGNYDAHGCLYLEEGCDPYRPSDNQTIYGHRMKDHTMFGQLANYDGPEGKAFWEQHQYIYFDSLTEHRTYQIIFVFVTTASIGEGFPYHEYVDFYDLSRLSGFLSGCSANEVFHTGLTAQLGDELITLSTCEYTHENGRLVVVAKRID